MGVKLEERASSQSGLSQPMAEQDISVGLLGGFELSVGGRVRLVPKPAQRLLVFLALHHRPLTRSYVAQSLWLEATERRADGNLRYALWCIGKLEAGLVDKPGGHLALGRLVGVDVHRSATLASRLLNDPESVDESELDEEMLSEDFLPDWHEEWILQEQEQYRQLRLHALESLCFRLISFGRFHRAVQAGLAAVAAEPLAERANLVLMQAYLAEGNAGEALRHSRSFGTLLHDELGERPSQAFRQATDSLRGQ
jgi:DNA-binding SARP family transcriptional activator